MIDKVMSAFSIPGKLVKAVPFGSGLINETFLCEFADFGAVSKFILQHINRSVFIHPVRVMENVERVTEHIQGRLRKEGVGDPESMTPALIRTKSGRSFHLDETGEFWRMFHFIETCEVYETVAGRDHAFEVGRGLGRFQALVSDLAPERLHDTLPGFHHTPMYLQQFDEAVRTDVRMRAAEVSAVIEFVNQRRSLAPLLVDMMNSGRIPIRVVHNDPKVNNILINAKTREAVCMVDLDTVKPGIVLFDFGDCVRSAANPAGEDAEDLDSVMFDLALYEALLRGYLSEAVSFLSKTELEMLPVSVKVITFELGLRFLTDYLRGDTYFKIRYPAHNLHRARVQFSLLKSIEASDLRMPSNVNEQP